MAEPTRRSRHIKDVRIGIATGLSVIALLAGCDESGGRASGIPGAGTPVGEDCGLSAELLLECGSEDCDLTALRAELSACDGSPKADDSESGGSWMDQVQGALVDKARSCFEARDASCLENVYFAMAAGGKVKGYHAAASMLYNFLTCGDDPKALDLEIVQKDPGVEDAVAQFEQEATDEAQQYLGDGTAGATIELASKLTVGTGDLWYAMGTFTMEASGYVEVDNGAIERLTLDYVARDRYDWHPGAEAEGDEGIGKFKDEWAQFLVDEGVACEFDMRTEWSADVGESGNAPTPTGPSCCSAHGDKGCGDTTCQDLVCDSDPECCASGWEGFCVARASTFTSCGCDGDAPKPMPEPEPEPEPTDSGGDDGGGTDGDGGGDFDSCAGNCGVIGTQCACDSECGEYGDCCSDYDSVCMDDG